MCTLNRWDVPTSLSLFTIILMGRCSCGSAGVKSVSDETCCKGPTPSNEIYKHSVFFVFTQMQVSNDTETRVELTRLCSSEGKWSKLNDRTRLLFQMNFPWSFRSSTRQNGQCRLKKFQLCLRLWPFRCEKLEVLSRQSFPGPLVKCLHVILKNTASFFRLLLCHRGRCPGQNNPKHLDQGRWTRLAVHIWLWDVMLDIGCWSWASYCQWSSFMMMWMNDSFEEDNAVHKVISTFKWSVWLKQQS